jgi:hypothetical protein
VSKPKIIAAIKSTKPTFSHAEAEDLMEILLKSGHPRAEYLAAKLVTSSGNAAPVYARTLARVRTNVILTAGGHVGGDPIPPQLLQKLVLASFPEAVDFELVGWAGRYTCEGVTFRIGEDLWRFAAPNGYVPYDDYPTRSAATEAFGVYMEKELQQ